MPIRKRDKGAVREEERGHGPGGWRGSAGGSDFDSDGYSAGSSFGSDHGTNNHNDYDRVRDDSDRKQ